MARGTISEIKAGVWLLWVGIGVGATLSAAGSSWIVSQLASLFFYAIWAANNLEGKVVLRSFLFSVIEIFFRNVDVAGSARIPDTGPVLFACGPHNNQFVDGIVMLRATAKRKDVSMIAAAVTMRRKWVGRGAKMLGAVPVERPQDLAVAGKGKITLNPDDPTRVQGHGTRFMSNVNANDTITFSGSAYAKASARVSRVENDSELVLVSPAGAFGRDALKRMSASSYKVTPYVDQTKVFKGVHDHLGSGGAVAIFPEGGSHDRTHMLPLKPGVAIMALGAANAYPGLRVPIVPVGINYFKAHVFRSRVFVDIGEPIYPDDDMVKAFAQGGALKRAACSALMDEIEAGLHATTIQVEDFDILQLCRFMRRVYPSSTRVPDAYERFQLMKAMSEGYKRDTNDFRLQSLRKRADDYFKLLKSLDIPDHKVALAQLSDSDLDRTLVLTVDTANLVLRISLLLVYILCALPGMLLFAPVVLLADNVSRREAAKALSKSSVKIAGRDVISTWKLMVSLSIAPVLHLIYTIVFAAIGGPAVGTAYFFFGPLLAGLAVLAIERGWSLFRSIRILFVALYNPQQGDTLVLTRSQLQHDVRQLVKQLDWDVALKRNSKTRHLFRRFSRAGMSMASVDGGAESVLGEDAAATEEWELGDSFFRTPVKRESARGSHRSSKKSNVTLDEDDDEEEVSDTL